MGQHPSRHQPIWQRHTLQLPRHGEIAIYFGNRYADLIRYVFDSGKHLDNKRLRQMIEDIEAFEQDLVNNHTDIIKCWFSVENKPSKSACKTLIPPSNNYIMSTGFAKRPSAVLPLWRQTPQLTTALAYITLTGKTLPPVTYNLPILFWVLSLAQPTIRQNPQ